MIGDYDNAIEYYLNSVGEIKDTSTVYNNLGYAYFEKNYYDDALRCFSYAFDIDPNHWDAALGAAISYFESNDFAEAKRCYEIAAGIEKRLKEGMPGFENIVEKEGYFYTEKQILCINKLCKYFGYEYYD